MKSLRFGVLLIIHRLSKDLTQRRVAQSCGLDLKAYQHIEAGQHEPLGSTTLRLIAGTSLKFTPDDLTVWVDKGQLLEGLGYAKEADHAAD